MLQAKVGLNGKKFWILAQASTLWDLQSGRLKQQKTAFKEIPAYPDSNSNALRQAIASHFTGLTKNNVIVGNGSTELMYLFADTFMRKGDIALIPAPTFGEYESAVRKTGEAAEIC